MPASLKRPAQGRAGAIHDLLGSRLVPRTAQEVVRVGLESKAVRECGGRNSFPAWLACRIPMAAAGGLQRHAIGNRFRFFENLVGKFSVNICQSRYRALPGKDARHTLVEGANLRVGRPARSDVPVHFHHVSKQNLPVRPRRSAYVVQTMSCAPPGNALPARRCLDNKKACTQN